MDVKLEGIINYKIMSIESYKSTQSKDIIFVKSEFLKPISPSDKKGKGLDDVPDLD
jgi:hypothetical protein